MKHNNYNASKNYKKAGKTFNFLLPYKALKVIISLENKTA